MRGNERPAGRKPTVPTPPPGRPRCFPPSTPPGWERRRRSPLARTQPQLGILPATVPPGTDRGRNPSRQAPPAAGGSPRFRLPPPWGRRLPAGSSRVVPLSVLRRQPGATVAQRRMALSVNHPCGAVRWPARCLTQAPSSHRGLVCGGPRAGWEASSLVETPGVGRGPLVAPRGHPRATGSARCPPAAPAPLSSPRRQPGAAVARLLVALSVSHLREEVQEQA